MELHDLIVGKADMADMVRAHDWSATALGPIHSWSDSLRSTVNMLLALVSPAIIYWGRGLTAIYNDAYCPILTTRHPDFLGRPVREVWSEVWDLIGSDLDAVMSTGRATHKREALIPILAYGEMQDFYFNYSFSPLYEDGIVVGVLNLAEDTTETVLARRKLHSTTGRLNQVLDATTDGVISLNEEWRITYVNQRGKQITAPQGEILGCNFWETFPALSYEGRHTLSTTTGRWTSTFPASSSRTTRSP